MTTWDDIHPAWKVCVGLIIVVFLETVIGTQVLLRQQNALNEAEQVLDEIQVQQKGGEERAYINRAIAGCADIINDGEIELTQECVHPRVVVYYPPSICAKLPVTIETCGSKAVVIE